MQTRTLNFIVNGQTIVKDQMCDFSKISPGTSGYLKAYFSMSNEWMCGSCFVLVSRKRVCGYCKQWSVLYPGRSVKMG